jgi:flagellar biosynthesis protein FlhF
MIKNGINEHYARLFLQRTGVFNGNSDNGMNNVKEKVSKEIKQVIKTKDPFKVGENRPIIAAFIGTTGVGKTTTIAKLAAQLMLKFGKKVGLISIDAYRIGAMEQLNTYANILGIPCFKAFKKKDLLFALKKMEGKNVVLIDTAGQSQYDMSRIEELKRMMPGDMNINTHLLLSVATTESEMNKAAVNFSALKYHSYIFTKIDETERWGSIINQVMKLNLPISYITNGQKVPEDIEQADKAKILKLLLSKD